MEYELSEREIEIIRLVATGASNKEIAQTLVISPNTVKVHLRNIFTKLEVASRTEATMVAIRQGWVEPPGNQNEAADDGESNNQSKSSEDLDGSSAIHEPKLSISRKVFLIVGLAIVVFGLVFLFIMWSNRNNQIQSEILPEQINQSEAANRWDTLASVPQSVMGMAFARYEQEFYLIGGKSNTGINEKIWIYDIETNSWANGLALSEGLWNIEAAVIGEKIYVPGGINQSEKISRQLMVYDPRGNLWSKRAELPFPISDYCLAAFEGKLYLFGGWDGTQYSDQVLVYTPEDDEWIRFGSMPKAKGACSASVVGGKIHVLGGKNTEGVFNDHDLFTPQRYLQNEDPWETAAELPDIRTGMESGVLADMIYVAGGVDKNGNSLDLIQYFPPKDLWVSIDQPMRGIGEFPAVLTYETRLYIIGGLLGDQYSVDHQVYQAVYTILVPIVR